MAYATVADVQARVLQSLATLGPATEPSESTVEGWIDGASAWIDGALSWKYQVPVTDATDLALLKPICSAWVAAQVYEVLEGTPTSLAGGVTLNRASQRLREEAIIAFVYQPGGVRTFVPGAGQVLVSKDQDRAGKSFLVLTNTAPATTGEAAVRQPLGTFTDPEAEGSEPRLFGAGREF